MFKFHRKGERDWMFKFHVLKCIFYVPCAPFKQMTREMLNGWLPKIENSLMLGMISSCWNSLLRKKWPLSKMPEVTRTMGIQNKQGGKTNWINQGHYPPLIVMATATTDEVTWLTGSGIMDFSKSLLKWEKFNFWTTEEVRRRLILGQNDFFSIFANIGAEWFFSLFSS